MSEAFAEAANNAGETEAIELPHDPLSAFGSLMDALAPDEDQPATDEGAAATGAAGSGEAADAAAGEAAVGGAGNADGAGVGSAGQAGNGGDAGAGAGDTGDAAAADTGDAGTGSTDVSGAGDRPAAWTVEPTAVVPQLGELSTRLEENLTKAFQEKAFEDVKTEHAKYFYALNKHPRLLVGTEVPALQGEGTETLRDSNDAKEWQEAIRSILIDEIKDRAGRSLEEQGDFLTTVHASIDLFKNNTDLIPGTKSFDMELANEFATLASPYELRVDGKLQGYSVPVQPLINQLRTKLAATRSAAAPAAAAAAPAKGGAPAKPARKPQAGIPAKAGSSGAQAEDYSTLFGTLGLPNLTI